MSALTEWLFWSSLSLIFYAYFGYPLLLWLISQVSSRKVNKGAILPSVTFIITAYNEERRIKEKLENTLRLSYPEGLMEIVVASDSSSDGTDEIVRSYAIRGVTLIRAPQRKGKEAAQKLAVQYAKGEILVFSDVATVLSEDAIRNIVSNFSDSTVGCVSSVDRFIDKDGRISGEGAYVKYEMLLRSLEARVNSLVGLSGSFFAARSVICRQGWSEDLQSDFNTVLNSMRMGFRGVADPQSVGYYKNITDERKEFERKVRTVLRGISVFAKSVALINFGQYRLFAWQLISHKLCRWLVPFALALLLLSNLMLIKLHWLYGAVLFLQLLFYGIGAIGWAFPSVPIPLRKIPTFFVVVNLAIMQAWYRYLRGDRIVGWQPSERSVMPVVDEGRTK